MEKRPDLRGSLDIFHSCVASPLDRTCELAAYTGAARSIDNALDLLITPSPRILEIQGNLALIVETCQEHYDDISAADEFETHQRSLSAYPTWESLVTSGFLKPFQCQGAEAAQGANLALAWVGVKHMADGYMRQISKSMPGCNVTSLNLLHEIGQLKAERGKVPEWFGQFEKYLTEFWREFDLHNHQAPLKKSFEAKVMSEWGNRAAFPGPKRRAAVLTKDCLSLHQVETALGHPGTGGFASTQHRQIALWFVGFSGLNTQTVSGIPLIRNGFTVLQDNWVAYYDVESGIFFRDYTSLAKSSAKAEGLEGQPASYVFATPVPQAIADAIRMLLSANPNCLNLGELVQELTAIQPEWTLYPSMETLKPSWAKWARTPGPLLRQIGIDALLAALLTGDMGVTARSKLYYCLIQPQEIWDAAGKAYKALGLGDAVKMP